MRCGESKDVARGTVSAMVDALCRGYVRCGRLALAPVLTVPLFIPDLGDL